MKAPQPWPDPPRTLGEHGGELWVRVQSEYAIEDAGGIEVLAQACLALDRAEALAARINAEGESVKGPTGLRPHPCLKDETQNRALVCRCLARLGVLSEEIRPMGRGPGRKAKGWTGDAD